MPRDVNRLELGGRIFHEIRSSTIEHDFKFYELARRAGLDNVTQAAGETPEQLAARLLETILASGLALELLGLLLVPEGTPPEKWTPEIMAETARFIGGLTSDEDRQTVNAAILDVMIGFFRSGLASFWSSTTSSVGVGNLEVGPDNRPTASIGSGAGPRSSSSSRIPTSRRRRGFFAGLFGTLSRPTGGA
jgi:hypothetical protein